MLKQQQTMLEQQQTMLDSQGQKIETLEQVSEYLIDKLKLPNCDLYLYAICQK